MKHYDRIDRQMTIFIIINDKTTNTKRKKLLATLDRKNNNTASLIEINVYSSIFIFVQANSSIS